MSATVIAVENLEKCYRLNHRQAEGLRHALQHWAALPIRLLRGGGGSACEISDDFLALREVTFTVQQGDVVGVIGRNGSGKSTLLKILSRITDPSRGKVRIKGRVASLLEVGTGFHPELTGRENIFLNGAILGMSRREISRKFDEIIAFAEVDRFLDTPVKRYSSGMYVRLAFAVAAHLDPEILIVDEVLAVGDAQFQKKCLGKIQDVASKSGRTVLFVSHSMDAIMRLCSRAILLKEGQIAFQGETERAVQQYLEATGQLGMPGKWLDLGGASRTSNRPVFLDAVRYTDGAQEACPVSGGALKISVRIVSDKHREVQNLAVTLYSRGMSRLINADTHMLAAPVRLKPGFNEVHFMFPSLHLNPGCYPMGLWLAHGVHDVLDHKENACDIQVTDTTGTLVETSPYEGPVPCDFSFRQD